MEAIKGAGWIWGLLWDIQTDNHLLRSQIRNLLTHILWPYTVIDQWLTIINPVHIVKTCFYMIYWKSVSQFKPRTEKWTFCYAVIQRGTLGSIPNFVRSRRPTNRKQPFIVTQFWSTAILSLRSSFHEPVFLLKHSYKLNCWGWFKFCGILHCVSC